MPRFHLPRSFGRKSRRIYPPGRRQVNHTDSNRRRGVCWLLVMSTDFKNQFSQQCRCRTDRLADPDRQASLLSALSDQQPAIPPRGRSLDAVRRPQADQAGRADLPARRLLLMHPHLQFSDSYSPSRHLGPSSFSQTPALRSRVSVCSVMFGSRFSLDRLANGCVANVGSHFRPGGVSPIAQ